MTDGTTLPRMLRHNAQTMPERPALREKNRGIWQTYSWARYYREVGDFALGLAALVQGLVKELSGRAHDYPVAAFGYNLEDDQVADLQAAGVDVFPSGLDREVFAAITR